MRNDGLARSAGFVWHEACHNVAAWAVVSLGCITLVAGLALAVSRDGVRRAGTAFSVMAELDGAGRDVVRVVAQERGLLPSAFCDSLGSMSVARSSFGITPGPRLRLANGVVASSFVVTPGAARYLRPRSPNAGSMIGKVLARKAGLTEGSWLSFGIRRRAAGPEARTVSLISGSERSRSFDDAALLVKPPTGGSSECWVEAVRGGSGQLSSAIGNLGPSGVRIAVVPLRPDLAVRGDPEATLRRLPGELNTLTAGLVSAVIVLAFWFIRRQEWALYRSFGTQRPVVLGIALVEWIALAAVPLAIGTAWGVATAGANLDERAYRLGATNAAVALLVSLCAVPLWATYLRVASVVGTLREA